MSINSLATSFGAPLICSALPIFTVDVIKKLMRFTVWMILTKYCFTKHVQVLQLVGVGSIKSGPALHAYGF